MIPILSAENVTKTYLLQGGELPLVSNASISIRMGETVGLVGESGSGKTTLARMLVRLIEPTTGKIMFHGKNVKTLFFKELQVFRKEVQMIFQDPFGSLNPQFTVKQIVGEPFEIHTQCSTEEIQEQVVVLLEKVGLNREVLQKYPREFSGGQRQRIGIARALAVGPKLIIADEPVSALDVSIQAQILNLLLDLQEKEKLSYLLISHDLRVVQFMADRIVVMYLGNIVETLPASDVEKQAKHPYTQMLWESVSSLKSSERATNPSRPTVGCVFQQRCPKVEDRCKKEAPSLREIQKEQLVACHIV